MKQKKPYRKLPAKQGGHIGVGNRRVLAQRSATVAVAAAHNVSIGAVQRPA